MVGLLRSRDGVKRPGLKHSSPDAVSKAILTDHSCGRLVLCYASRAMTPQEA